MEKIFIIDDCTTTHTNDEKLLILTKYNEHIIKSNNDLMDKYLIHHENKQKPFKVINPNITSSPKNYYDKPYLVINQLPIDDKDQKNVYWNTNIGSALINKSSYNMNSNKTIDSSLKTNGICKK